ncbi:thioredoxin-domain-containing protein [Pisolithus orientalis]|uniref:thioredoxin-domain-containing protein n=1 Tax=Pisolithus orientalis TaxID=936130 RepID=UPI002224FD5C|nr:thioredoxin-domain-containing protein [Pisolithus orientalis]KAI6012442.1 thioredoxin-domain-containing protein [Pisolithus orientalis]
MAITHLTSISQLTTILSGSNDKLTVIDFHATCEYPSVNFLKCDVDAAKNVASAYGVSAMPTFVFLKGGKQVHTIKGADKQGLQNALKQLTGPTAGTFPGQGQTLRGSPSSDDRGSTWTNMDPQLKILLALVAAYIFFWLM